ncbi:hypothetical protein KXX52_008900, partial [Aspergillus fumigatus]
PRPAPRRFASPHGISTPSSRKAASARPAATCRSGSSPRSTDITTTGTSASGPASEGARLVLNDLAAGPVDELGAEVRAAGGQALACTGSVTAPDFAERFIGTAVAGFQGIDILINHAGYTWDNVIQKMSDEQWYAMVDCHLTAPFRILRAAQP